MINSITGKTSITTPVKETSPEKTFASKGEGSSTTRIHFEIENEEMDPDPNGEQEEATDEHRESPKLARAPSFFIGKPLVDFDAGIGRVS